MLSLDFVCHKLGFRLTAPGRHDAKLFALPGVGPEILSKAPCVVANQGVRGVQNMAGRAVVLLEPHHVIHTEFTREVSQILDIRASERINRLVIITHRED